MKKIIGGLLVITLLSRPSMLRHDYIAYEIFKAQENIILYVKKIAEEEEKTIEPEDVDGMLMDIDRNKRSINVLLKDKYNIVGKIQTMMGLKAKTKTVMSEDQIVVYREFSDFYNDELNSLNQSLSEIEDRLSFNNLHKEIIKNDTDFRVVYEELKVINDRQYDAIYNLNNIINMGEKTLAVL